MVVSATAKHDFGEEVFSTTSIPRPVVIGTGDWIAIHSVITARITIGKSVSICDNALVTNSILSKF